MSTDAMVRALLDERAGYVARGMSDRVAQVDAQLERHGYTVQQQRSQPAKREKATRAPREKRG